MNLFIDTISKIWTIILFDNNRKIIDKKNLDFKKNESSKLIPNITNILEKNLLNYNSLKNIVIVNGPWSFTWIRSSILVVNSINFIIKKNITTISFFELFDNYPIIKASSKRDSFIKNSKNSLIEIIENHKLIKKLQEKNIKKIYWEIDEKLFENIEIINKIDYEKIIKNLKFDNLKIAQANYIKKPNIT
jgi:tRNA A37 threonylcarbamoyladenosine modification protein TsaB